MSRRLDRLLPWAYKCFSALLVCRVTSECGGRGGLGMDATNGPETAWVGSQSPGSAGTVDGPDACRRANRSSRGRGGPYRARRSFTAFCLAFCAVCAAPAIASATTVNWSCTVGPSGVCKLNEAQRWEFSQATNTASFNVSALVQFVDTAGDILTQGWGNTCNSCLYTGPGVVDTAAPYGYVEIYNPDPNHTRTFQVESIYP
jgi:hypothetical protein